MNAERRTGRLAFLILLIPFLGWWTYGLFDLDEGFYAAVTGEMLRRGEWITPYLNGEPWFEKPILVYWFAIPSVAAFGEMVGPRLPSVVASLLTGWVLYAFARRRLSPGAAPLAVAALGSCLLFVAVGRMMMTDPWLMLTLTGGFCAFWESLVGDRRWRWAAGFLLGVSVLAKGPVGLALFGFVMLVTLARERSLRPAFRGGWAVGVALLLAAVATWYLPAYLVNRDVFVQKFLIEQNVERFLGGDEAHSIDGALNWIFYVPVFFLGAAPWAFFAARAMRWKIAEGDDEGAALRRYLTLWMATVFVFFTLAGSKLPHYILPMLPAAALLAADRLARRWGAEAALPTRKLLWPAVGAVGIGAFAQFGFSFYYGQFHAEIHALTRYVRAETPPGAAIAEYQMSRQSRELGTGKPKIQETSHPSILFYLDRTVIDTESLDDLTTVGQPVWILTRWNRIDETDVRRMAAKGFVLSPHETPVREDYYRLWRLGPR